MAYTTAEDAVRRSVSHTETTTLELSRLVTEHVAEAALSAHGVEGCATELDGSIAVWGCIYPEAEDRRDRDEWQVRVVQVTP